MFFEDATGLGSAAGIWLGIGEYFFGSCWKKLLNKGLSFSNA